MDQRTGTRLSEDLSLLVVDGASGFGDERAAAQAVARAGAAGRRAPSGGADPPSGPAAAILRASVRLGPDGGWVGRRVLAFPGMRQPGSSSPCSANPGPVVPATAPFPVVARSLMRASAACSTKRGKASRRHPSLRRRTRFFIPVGSHDRIDLVRRRSPGFSPEHGGSATWQGRRSTRPAYRRTAAGAWRGLRRSSSRTRIWPGKAECIFAADR